MKHFLITAITCLMLSHAAMAAEHLSTVATTVHDVASTAPSVAQSGAQAIKSVADASTSVINNVVDKASAGLAQITSKLEAGAPEAWRLVVAGTKAKAEATLLVGLFAGISALLSWLAFGSAFNKADFCNGNKYVLVSILFGVLAFGSSITASLYLLSSDAWAAYLSPEGILALGILNMALSHT